MVQINSFLVALTMFLIVVLVALIIYLFFIRKDVIGTASTGGASCINPPPPPTNLIISNPTPDIVAVSWDEIETASIYRLYLSKTPNFLVRDAEHVRSTTQTGVGVGNLETGFTYYAKATSSNACGESSPSNEVSILVPYKWPDIFEIINADDASLNIVRLDVGVNIEKLIINTGCSIGGSDCRWKFNDIDQTLRFALDTNKCLIRDGDELWGRDCTSSDLDQRQWQYSPATKTLCLLNNDNVCIRLEDNFFVQQLMTVGPPTGNLLSRWNLFEV